MRETQETVSQWSKETFGPPSCNMAIFNRARKEWTELLEALEESDTNPRALEECADLVIILYRLASELGGDLHAEIDRKMAINRDRKWIDPKGQYDARHIEE